ncbi:hypothetical protein AMP9_3529 [plant metagenome]|uniref:Uncharacterized protein n=1 Tax=plant metagenome TaxID=1297885 RepID=A0A484NTQ0_9ZZZZ
MGRSGTSTSQNGDGNSSNYRLLQIKGLHENLRDTKKMGRLKIALSQWSKHPDDYSGPLALETVASLTTCASSQFIVTSCRRKSRYFFLQYEDKLSGS